jgi:hypothetical protein
LSFIMTCVKAIATINGYLGQVVITGQILHV